METQDAFPMRALGFVLVTFALSGCAGVLLDAPDIETSVRDHIQSAIDGDADRFVSYMHPEWVDLGGGDGMPYDREEHRAELRQEFAGEEHKRNFGSQTPESLLRMGEARYREHADYSKDEEMFGAGRFAPKEDDVKVEIEPQPESPLFDGWSGYYRLSGDRWVMVAGD